MCSSGIWTLIMMWKLDIVRLHTSHTVYIVAVHHVMPGKSQIKTLHYILNEKLYS